MASGASGRPEAHTGRFTFVEWDKDQPTNRSLSTQHVTREIRRKKRLQQEAAKQAASARPDAVIGPGSLPSPPSTVGSSISPDPAPSVLRPHDYFTASGSASRPQAARVAKSVKQKKPSSNRPRSELTRKTSGLSIWELLAESDDIEPSGRRRTSKARNETVVAEIIRRRSLPSPVDALSSHRGNAFSDLVLSNPGDRPLLDYWLFAAPRLLRLDIFPSSQSARKPAFDVFFPMASRANEAVEHIVMLPAALSWAKSAGDHPYVRSMVHIHRAKCVHYLNEAISRLVDEKIMEEHTHIGLMSLIWAENMYGDAAFARQYSLAFREMVQLRLKQKLVPPRRDTTVIAHWLNALTTVDFWPQGMLNQKEIVDAENLLRPLFPFLESVRHLAHQRRFSAVTPLDRQRYLAPYSPLPIILLWSRPFDSDLDSSNDDNVKFTRLLLFRVLLLLHIGLLDTAQIFGPGQISRFFENLESAIKDMDVLASPSPLALLLWTILNDPRLSAVTRHRDVGMYIYPVRRLGTEWLSRLNRLLLTWLGLTDAEGSYPSESGSVSALLRADWEADQLPTMLSNLIIGSRTPTPETEPIPSKK